MKSQSGETVEEEGGRDFVTALARGLDVLRAFSGTVQDPTLAEVARAVGLSRATVRRSLHTLAVLGYVEVSGTRFRLTPQVLLLARSYLESSVLPRVAQPFLDQLDTKLGATCSLSILHSEDVIYLARSSQRRMASMHRDVGTHLPAWATSMGRVLLAALDDVALDAYLDTAKLVSYTRRTVEDRDQLRARIEEVRHDGYCVVELELERNLRAMAVPVVNAGGRTIAALSVAAEADAVPRRTLVRDYLPELQKTAGNMRALLPN
jgi:IclR family pca regulon transcriptional regulator